MELETTRFGRIEYDPESVIVFTQPIIGFQEWRRYLIMPGPTGTSVTWLQSVERGDLAFLVMDPHRLIPDYEVKLSGAELAELAVSSVKELEVYTLMVVPADRTQVRTNLKAPIVVNRAKRLGKQTILDRSDYPVQYFLAQPQQPGGTSREVANARSDT